MTDYTFSNFAIELKSPDEILTDINTSLAEAWGCSGSIHLTVAIPTGKAMRKVHHFKGRRYVTRYSMHDIFSGWFK